MDTFKSFADKLTDLIGNTVTDLLLTVAVAAFFWSVIMFIWNRSRGDVDAMKDASNRLLWSVIGLFVMFSIWGIVNFLQSGFGFENKNTIKAPSIQVNGGAGSPTGSTLKENGASCTANSQCKSGQCLPGRSGDKLCQG
jgi:hypothetical protein